LMAASAPLTLAMPRGSNMSVARGWRVWQRNKKVLVHI
jgi:hypothetical protein